MRNEYILELLEDGKIEELKALVRDEIYQKALTSTPGAKQRYAAMKRYFKYANMNNKACSLPCKDITLPDGVYNSFVDGYTLVLTSESIGDMESFDNTNGNYLKIDTMLNYSGDMELLNMNTVLAEAKTKGYKYKKSEIGTGKDFNYTFKYRDAYFKVGLLDQAFSIINDGNEAEVYYNGAKGLLMIKTSIGVCGVLPFNHMEDDEIKTTIKLESKYDTKAV
jgi:hypothetical protein